MRETHPSFLDGFVEELHHVHALHPAHLELLGPGEEDGLRRVGGVRTAALKPSLFPLQSGLTAAHRRHRHQLKGWGGGVWPGVAGRQGGGAVYM